MTNISDKAITALSHRFDEPRMLGRVAQQFAKTSHENVQVVIEVDEDVVAPKTPAQVFPRDRATGAFEQTGEHLKTLVGQLDRQTTLSEAAGVEIKFKNIEADKVGQCPAPAKLADLRVLLA